MDLNKLFWENNEDFSVPHHLFQTLHEAVTSKYLDIDRPILRGNVSPYEKFVGKKTLSEKSKSPESVLTEFSELFQRTVLWGNAGTMINITPPANIASLIASSYASFFNPNFAQDESSGYLLATEKIVSKYLSELVGWGKQKTKGVFTFGGKGTIMYATKVGLQKSFPKVRENGVFGKKAIIVSSVKSHPCHREVADWTGLGRDNCKLIEVEESGEICIAQLEVTLRNAIENETKIACIILNGGTTNELIVDPISKVVALRDNLVFEYNLDYIPHIHIDAVIGWAWLFFRFYDFEKNPLRMNDFEAKKISSFLGKIEELKYADSFGADFHKSGFCPYSSSIFMSKDKDNIFALGGKKSHDGYETMFGEYSPFQYTLELSRPSNGPISAYIAIESFGIIGFQKLIYRLFSNTVLIRSLLSSSNHFDVINMETEGIATLCMALPEKGKYNYNDYLKMPDQAIKNLLSYNMSFFLYASKKLEDSQTKVKFTFSRSYKPFGFAFITGAIKLYPASPIASKKEIKECINEMISMKTEFDSSNVDLIDKITRPDDFIYR